MEGTSSLVHGEVTRLFIIYCSYIRKKSDQVTVYLSECIYTQFVCV